MKTLSLKQKERSEKRKKKLAALANLVKLNDKDRLEEVMAERHDNNSKSNDDDGFIMVVTKYKIILNLLFNGIVLRYPEKRSLIYQVIQKNR